MSESKNLVMRISEAVNRTDEPRAARDSPATFSTATMELVGEVPMPLRHLQNLLEDIFADLQAAQITCAEQGMSQERVDRVNRLQHQAEAIHMLFMDALYEELSIDLAKWPIFLENWKVAVPKDRDLSFEKLGAERQARLVVPRGSNKLN